MSTAPNQSEKVQSDAKPADPSVDQSNKEEEEEEECGLCIYMKAGGCKDAFIDWDNCVKEAEDKNEDLVEKCSQVTARLMQCMNAHSNYYYPNILMSEKHVEEEAVIELEKEKQDSSANASPYESNQK